jgi:hypothetical protein
MPTSIQHPVRVGTNVWTNSVPNAWADSSPHSANRSGQRDETNITNAVSVAYAEACPTLLQLKIGLAPLPPKRNHDGSHSTGTTRR